MLCQTDGVNWAQTSKCNVPLDVDFAQVRTYPTPDIWNVFTTSCPPVLKLVIHNFYGLTDLINPYVFRNVLS